MRESSRNHFSTASPVNRFQFEAKSLFRNILAVTPCGSRFYLDQASLRVSKLLRIKILGKPQKKIWSDYGRTKDPIPCPVCLGLFIRERQLGAVSFSATVGSTSALPVCTGAFGQFADQAVEDALPGLVFATQPHALSRQQGPTSE